MFLFKSLHLLCICFYLFLRWRRVDIGVGSDLCSVKVILLLIFIVVLCARLASALYFNFPLFYLTISFSSFHFYLSFLLSIFLRLCIIPSVLSSFPSVLVGLFCTCHLYMLTLCFYVNWPSMWVGCGSWIPLLVAHWWPICKWGFCGEKFVVYSALTLDSQYLFILLLLLLLLFHLLWPIFLFILWVLCYFIFIPVYNHAILLLLSFSWSFTIWMDFIVKIPISFLRRELIINILPVHYLILF